ncbi:MAG: ABC transporter permease [Acidimicrobiaceae bacterium]|nr:ABC transporter permease [Acidimicrobiaceae bacterium]
MADQLTASDGPSSRNGLGVFPGGTQPDVEDWGTDALLKAGRKVVAALAIIGDLFSMVLDAVWSTAAAIVHRRFSWAEFFEQTWFLISVTFLPTLLLAIPFGLVLVLEVGGLAVQIGASGVVGAVDAIGIVREAAPVITAILLSGAGGSAICADLGARRMRDEIDAMWVMAVDPIERLVAPRVLATVVVALLLNGIVAFAGIMSGYLAAVLILHTSAGGFLNSFSAFAQPADAIESMFKAALFGLLAAVVASHQGLNAKKGPAGVGDAVNRSVVVTGVFLFVLNLIVTDVFLAIVPPRVL